MKASPLLSFSLLSLLLLAACMGGQNPTTSPEQEEDMGEETSEETPTPVTTTSPRKTQAEHCRGFTCAEAGGVHTCLREEGCICDSSNACIPCKNEDDLCATDADCCMGLGLRCQEVFVGNQPEKRCLRTADFVCDIVCRGDPGLAEEGIWGTPENCREATAPEGAENCQELVGSCHLSKNVERNTVKCYQG